MKRKVEVAEPPKVEVAWSNENSELHFTDIKFTGKLCDPAERHHMFEMPIQDEVSAFHALLDVQALVGAYTLRRVYLELVSGEEGVIGSTYEGRVPTVGKAARHHVMRYKLEEMSDTPGNRVVEYTVEECDNNGMYLRYSWRFEVKPGVVVLNKDITYMRPIPKILYPVLPLLAPVILILAIATIILIVCDPNRPVHNMFPVYRYLHDFTPSGALEGGLSGPRSGGKTPEVTELHQLFEMLKAGALTRDEFDALKKKVLDGTS